MINLFKISLKKKEVTPKLFHWCSYIQKSISKHFEIISNKKEIIFHLKKNIKCEKWQNQNSSEHDYLSKCHHLYCQNCFFHCIPCLFKNKYNTFHIYIHLDNHAGVTKYLTLSRLEVREDSTPPLWLTFAKLFALEFHSHLVQKFICIIFKDFRDGEKSPPPP